MEIVRLFELMANSAHHNKVVGELICEQPSVIKNILLANDAEELKRQFSDVEYCANESHVVQISH